MSEAARELTRDDIMPYADYAAQRADHRARVVALKKHRRVHVGPFATFYFENYATMWYQVQEMLHVEKGGDEQLADELAAYNPLIPQGHDLAATMMIEIDDERQRKHMLAQMGGIEDTVYIRIGDQQITAVADEDMDRTDEDGKTSSVHFLKFSFTPEQIAAFREPGAQIILGISHERYGHMALLTEDTRQSLAGDFA